MRLIETSENGIPVYSPEARTIKEFSAIIRRDGSKENDKNGRKKELAVKELAFVHFWCVNDSRYTLYDDEEERYKRIASDLDLPSDWQPDRIVLDAITKYSDLITTRSSKLVERADATIKKLEDFFDNLDLLGEDNKTRAGGLIIKPSDVTKFIIELPAVVKAKQEAEKLVRKELEEQGGKRLNENAGLFEQKEFSIDSSKPI